MINPINLNFSPNSAKACRAFLPVLRPMAVSVASKVKPKVKINPRYIHRNNRYMKYI